MDGPRIELVENCQLEWDKQRGVLYVHNKDTGATVLRICGLPKARNRGSAARWPDRDINVRAGSAAVYPGQAREPIVRLPGCDA